MNFNILNFKLLLLFLIIIALILLDFRKDNFDGLHDKDIDNEKYSSFIKDEKCCLVEKKLAEDGSGFYYDYNVVKCDQNNPRNLNHNLNDKRLISSSQIDMNKCNKENSNLGSCRKDTHECFDFFTKEQCNQHDKMVWAKIPCNMPYKYINKVEPYKIFDITEIKQKINS